MSRTDFNGIGGGVTKAAISRPASGPDETPNAALFTIPDYRRGWLLGVLTGVVRWLGFLALGIFAYQLTESPPLVALLAIVRVAPDALLGFAVGALTDRFDRKKLYLASLFVMTVLAGGLAL